MIVLRELLLNALIHGNKNVAERHIKCRIEKLEKARLKVEDEGSGFDYQNLDMRLPETPVTLKGEATSLLMPCPTILSSTTGETASPST